MKKTIFFTVLMLINMPSIKCQTASKGLYFGVYSAGYIRDWSEVKPPYYQHLRWTNISLFPKIGYRFNKHLTAGVIGNYSFFNSSFGNAEPSWGGGYFLKYTFRKSSDTSSFNKRLSYFVEFQHIFYDGYYVLENDIIPKKIDKTLNNPIIQIGFDIKVHKKKEFYIGLSGGLGIKKYYKNYQVPEEGERSQIKPFGLVTFQYNLKTKKQ